MSQNSNKLEEAKKMLEVQGTHGNWDYNEYMHGMYNGMEYVIAILEDREPIYKDAPEEWGDNQ